MATPGLAPGPRRRSSVRLKVVVSTDCMWTNLPAVHGPIDEACTWGEAGHFFEAGERRADGRGSSRRRTSGEPPLAPGQRPGFPGDTTRRWRLGSPTSRQAAGHKTGRDAVREHAWHALQHGGIGRQRRSGMRHHLPRPGPDPVKVRPAGPLPKRACSKQKCGWRNAGREREPRFCVDDGVKLVCLHDSRLCPQHLCADNRVGLRKREIRHERPDNSRAIVGARSPDARQNSHGGGRAGSSPVRPTAAGDRPARWPERPFPPPLPVMTSTDTSWIPG